MPFTSQLREIINEMGQKCQISTQKCKKFLIFHAFSFLFAGRFPIFKRLLTKKRSSLVGKSVLFVPTVSSAKRRLPISYHAAKEQCRGIPAAKANVKFAIAGRAFDRAPSLLQLPRLAFTPGVLPFIKSRTGLAMPSIFR